MLHYGFWRCVSEFCVMPAPRIVVASLVCFCSSSGDLLHVGSLYQPDALLANPLATAPASDHCIWTLDIRF